MTTTDQSRTSGMHRQRRTQSEGKHRAVRTAIDACITRGAANSAAGIARTATVTETFLYRHETQPCDLCQQIFGMGPVSYHRKQMSRIADSRDALSQTRAHLSAATIQADLANSQAANRRLQQRLQSLERRLGEMLGQEAQNSLPELARPTQTADPASEQRIRELSAQVSSLSGLLTERDEELLAVRRLNTDLTRRLNSPAN